MITLVAIPGNLENLKDKKVAIIGTGATSFNVPHLAASAKSFMFFKEHPLLLMNEITQILTSNGSNHKKRLAKRPQKILKDF